MTTTAMLERLKVMGHYLYKSARGCTKARMTAAARFYRDDADLVRRTRKRMLCFRDEMPGDGMLVTLRMAAHGTMSVSKVFVPAEEMQAQVYRYGGLEVRRRIAHDAVERMLESSRRLYDGMRSAN